MGTCVSKAQSAIAFALILLLGGLAVGCTSSQDATAQGEGTPSASLSKSTTQGPLTPGEVNYVLTTIDKIDPSSMLDGSLMKDARTWLRADQMIHSALWQVGVPRADKVMVGWNPDGAYLSFSTLVPSHRAIAAQLEANRLRPTDHFVVSAPGTLDTPIVRISPKPKS
jgi:hypothetical protein